MPEKEGAFGMDTRSTTVSIHFWRCGQGHQNSTELSAEERRQGAILLKCWVAGCPSQKVIPGRTPPPRTGDRVPPRGTLGRFFSKS